MVHRANGDREREGTMLCSGITFFDELIVPGLKKHLLISFIEILNFKVVEVCRERWGFTKSLTVNVFNRSF